MKLKKIMIFLLVILLSLNQSLVTYATTESSTTEATTTEDVNNTDSYWNFTKWSDEEQQQKVWNSLLITSWGEEVFEDDEKVRYTDENGEEQTRTKTFADYLTPKAYNPEEFSVTNVDASSLRGIICEYALSGIGNMNYNMGSSSIKGATDCSGFVNACYRAAFGVYYGSGADDKTKYPAFAGPTNTSHGCSTFTYKDYCGTGYGQLTKIPKEQTKLIKPGDIVVYSRGHAGIYIGGYTDATGKTYDAGSVIHIGSSDYGVHVSDMYYRNDLECFFSAIRLEEGVDFTTEQVKIMAATMRMAHDYFQTSMTTTGCKKLGMTLYNRWTNIHATETKDPNLSTKPAEEALASAVAIFKNFEVLITEEADATKMNCFYPTHTASYKAEWDAVYSGIENTQSTYMKYARQILSEDVANTAHDSKGELFYSWLPKDVEEKIKSYKVERSNGKKLVGHKIQSSKKCGFFYIATYPISEAELTAYINANPLPTETTETQ